VRSALSKVSRWFKTEPALARTFLNPAVPHAAKEKALKNILPPKAPFAVENLLKLLIRNKRLDLLHVVLARYEELADDAEGLVRARVRAAQDLTEKQQELLTQALGKALKRQVVGEFKKDAKLIGGFVVQFGNKVVDLSISGQLDRMKENLTKAS
jgi:F-type H+-transporting ATPase subunit delta